MVASQGPLTAQVAEKYHAVLRHVAHGRCTNPVYCAKVALSGYWREDPALEQAMARFEQERVESGDDSTVGYYHKFTVRRGDGSSGAGGKHEDCQYFVLDLHHDLLAPAALIAYADACQDANPALAGDLRTLARGEVVVTEADVVVHPHAAKGFYSIHLGGKTIGIVEDNRDWPFFEAHWRGQAWRLETLDQAVDQVVAMQRAATLFPQVDGRKRPTA